MSWSFARGFTNDSNYATLVIQFGAILSAIFILLILTTMARIARTAIQDPRDLRAVCDRQRRRRARRRRVRSCVRDAPRRRHSLGVADERDGDASIAMAKSSGSLAA